MACLAIAAAVAAPSQNIQLHYDLGHTLYGNLNSRPNVTTTVEMYKPDQWGNTFLFADIDYFTDGAAGAYWEVAREFNITNNKQWAAHVEYNGGLSTIEHTELSTRFQHALLAGGAWNWASAEFSRTFSLQALYKQYFKGQRRQAFSSFQLTAVWGVTFAHGLFSFTGYADMWRHPDVNGQLIVQSEPQLWFNFWNLGKRIEKLRLSLGTEVEVSNNFVFDNQGRNNRFYAIPTIAAKWTF